MLDWWVCRAGGRGSGAASATLSGDRADEAPAAAAAVAAGGRQWPSEGVHAAAVQLADGNVLGAQRTGDVHRAGRVHA